MDRIKINICKEIIKELQDKSINTITLRPYDVPVKLEYNYVKMEDVIHVLISHLKEDVPEKIIEELNN